MGEQQKKVKGVADIVFLIDCSGSMSELMPGLKDNIGAFIDFLENGAGQDVTPVHDWRARMVGYRDVEADGANWFIDNPFVTDVAALKAQLATLVASGGGDEPESLLDGLYKVISIGQTDKQASPDPSMWRYLRSAARVVIVFTDASFKRTVALADAAGASVSDIITLAQNERIAISIFAPADAPGDDGGYNSLAELDRLEWMTVEPGNGLREYTGDRKAFQETLKQLAKTVSQTAETEVIEAAGAVS